MSPLEFHVGRAHFVPVGMAGGLCGLPVHDRYPARPEPPTVCPECALVFVCLAFPAHRTGHLAMTDDIVVAAEEIALLGRLRQACALLEAAIPTDELSPAIATNFMAACALPADAVRRLSAQLPPPVDESLRAAAINAHRRVRHRRSDQAT